MLYTVICIMLHNRFLSQTTWAKSNRKRIAETSTLNPRYDAPAFLFIIPSFRLPIIMRNVISAWLRWKTRSLARFVRSRVLKISLSSSPFPLPLPKLVLLLLTLCFLFFLVRFLWLLNSYSDSLFWLSHFNGMPQSISIFLAIVALILFSSYLSSSIIKFSSTSRG